MPAAEKEVDRVGAPFGRRRLRNQRSDSGSGPNGNRPPLQTLRSAAPGGGRLSGRFAAFGNIIDQIVDMKRIAAGKNTRHRGHSARIDTGSRRHRIDFPTESLKSIVFRNQSDRENQRVARNKFFRSLNRNQIFVDPDRINSFNPIPTGHFRHRTSQMKRNRKIGQTLGDIPTESRRFVLDFVHADHFRSFQRQPPRHNQPDIAAA